MSDLTEKIWKAFGGAAIAAPKEKGGGQEIHHPGEIQMLQTNIENTKTNGKTAKADNLFADADVTGKRRAEAWLSDRLAASKKLGKSELISEVVQLTPALAEVILDTCNIGNRLIRRRRVEIFTQAIKEGRWQLTSQGISFTRDGLLNNGQHRLQAIIEAARTVPMQVTFGEKRDAFSVLDAGAVRGGNDTLHIAGYKNTAVLSAAARLLRLIEGGNLNSNYSFPNDLIQETVVSHHPTLENATTDGARIAKKLKTSSAATTVAMFFITAQTSHARRIDQFVDKLAEGHELGARDPILVLRDMLQKGVLGEKGHVTGAVAKTAAIIKAWNLWIHGRSATYQSLRFRPDEGFPDAE